MILDWSADRIGERRNAGRVIAASVIGNALEWFDFIVYALLAGTISKLFFPSEDPMTSILLGFATFGIAFVARPIGGIVFGLYADRHGRKKALGLIFVMMAVATAMVALLPTYAAIGIAAPVLLLVCRMLQGFSAGGEFGSATAVLIEFAPRGSKGFFGSLQMCSQALAVVAAAVFVFLLSRNLSPADFESWGWRVPFLAGAIVGPIGFYFRTRLSETPEFERAMKVEASASSVPLPAMIKRHRVELLAAIGLFAAVTGPNYVNTVYMPSMAVARHGVAQSDAMLAVLAVAVVMAVLIPIFGWLADKVSRINLAIAGMVGTAVMYSVLFPFYMAAPSATSFLWLQLGYAAAYAALVGASCTLAIEHFPVLARATGGATGYNIATMVFGGMCPFWLALLDKAGGTYAPMIYIVVTMGIGVCGAILLGRQGKGSARQNFADGAG